MTVDITVPRVQWSEHDICYTAWILLNCSGRVRYDGAVTDELDPGYTDTLAGQVPAVVGQCGVNSTAITREINAAVVDTGASGQTNVNSARRRVRPTISGFTGVIQAPPRIDPLIWQLTELGAPITDPLGDQAGTGPVYMGVEEPVAAGSACPTCGSTASCGNEVAIITFHNAWCGDDPIPGWPYVAFIQKSLLFEPTNDTDTLGQGFGTGRTYNYSLQNNALFVDPWGIHPGGAAGAANNKWSRMLVSAARFAASNQAGWGLQDLLNSCDCSSCTTP